MRTIIIGDPGSGKTTLLKHIQKLGGFVVFEKGRDLIPPKEESNKYLSNKWFCDYYFHRDKDIWNSDMFFEYSLHRQIPFTHAQYSVGKISKQEHALLLEYIEQLSIKLPIQDSIVYHFTIPTDVINCRQELRGRTQSITQNNYYNILREETENYFKSQPVMYKKINTHTEDLGRLAEELYSHSI